MSGEVERLRAELSRTVAHRSSLQEALAAAETERNALRIEESKLRGEYQRAHGALEDLHRRSADLHGALNAARAEKQRLEAALAAALSVKNDQLGAPAPPEPVGPAEPVRPAEGAPTAPPPAQPKPSPRLRSLPSAPVIEARNLYKTYRVPAERMDTLKERAMHPFRGRRANRLEALRDVSFDIRRGEFYGIAGANGSGKSTLLKLLADVYAPDSGTIRSAGRIAPFIELGVGLNPEFAAFDNVVISGVTMGLEPEEARARYPEIIEFAGLQDFTELKLKNYSSGMRVRLAFAVMVQVDADILLIDEVLAVGDAEFRQKCLARTHRLRNEGKTVILVTHSMDTLAQECDRALLLRHGEVVVDGDPQEVAQRYLSEMRDDGPEPEGGSRENVVRLVEG